MAVGIACAGRWPHGQASGFPARRTATGSPTPPTSRARSTRRSIKSRAPISTSSRSPGGSRPTISARGPSSSSRARRWRFAASLYTTAGTRRSVVALDGRTGELIWSHSYREGNRAAIAPRQLSGRGVSYWTDGKGDERILYVTPGLSADRAEREERSDGADVRRRRRGRSEEGCGVRQGPADRSRDRRNRPARDADGGQGHRSSSARRSRKARRSSPTTTPKAWCAPSTCGPAS